MKVGVIGLGMQGAPMAQMIAAAGHELHVWARRPGALAPLVALGAVAHDDAAGLAASVDHLEICVTNDDDVMEVITARGVLEAMRPGSLLALHSTVRPPTHIQVGRLAAARGIAALDAPVSGSVAGALSKTLLVIVGGAAAALEQARPVFESYGNPIIHVGDLGAASYAKLVNNLMASVNIGLTHRALSLGKTVGIDPDQLRQAIGAGTGSNYVMNTIPKFDDPAYSAHVKTILDKDLSQALASFDAEAIKPMDELSRLASSILAELAQGRGRLFD